MNNAWTPAVRWTALEWISSTVCASSPLISRTVMWHRVFNELTDSVKLHLTIIFTCVKAISLVKCSQLTVINLQWFQSNSLCGSFISHSPLTAAQTASVIPPWLQRSTPALHMYINLDINGFFPWACHVNEEQLHIPQPSRGKALEGTAHICTCKWKASSVFPNRERLHLFNSLFLGCYFLLWGIAF